MFPPSVCECDWRTVDYSDVDVVGDDDTSHVVEDSSEDSDQPGQPAVLTAGCSHPSWLTSAGRGSGAGRWRGTGWSRRR